MLAHWRSLPLAGRSRSVLGVVVLGIATYLVFAPKPWSVPWPEAEFPPYDYYVKVYSWWGALVALGGAGLLAATASWWSRPWTRRFDPPPPAPRWFWPLVGAAMLLTGVMGSWRLGQDLWDDERTTLQRFVQGNYKTNADGSVRFREFGFGRTLHEYRMPNNHVLHSIFARASVSVWRIFRDPAGQPFSEVALRLPAFLFGIASVAALALMLKELGMARAGVIAAFLLGIHPWHIRYASEARGYALVLCFLPLLMVCLLRALRTGAWKWWIAVGALQFGLLYAYPATLYPVAATNAAVLLLVAAGVPGTVPRAVLFARWLVPVFVAALAFTWLFLPCVPQLREYLASERAQGAMGHWWIKDFLSHLFAGVSWFKSHNPDAAQPELFSMLSSAGVIGRAVLWACLIFFALGVGRFVVRGFLSSAVASLLLLPALAAYLVARASGSFLYEWYLIYLLPGTVAMVATGIDATGLPWRDRRWSAAIPAFLLVVLGAGYLQLTAKARDWLLTRPLQPMRASVLLTRPTTLPNYPGHADVITASFNTPPALYDPHVVAVRTPDELRALMKRCAEKVTPLYLNVGNPLAAAFHHPEMFAMMNDPTEFDILAQLPGYDPTLDRVVARYRQAAADSGGP